MEPNILLKRAPSAVKVGGAMLSINTSWRTGIKAMLIVDDPTLDDMERTQLLLLAYYQRETDGRLAVDPLAAEHPKEAIERALGFLNLNEPPKPRKVQAAAAQQSKVRTFDWNFDAPLVIADFQREYGIDLTDPDLKMHWWRFWPLFKNLSDTSSTMTVIGIRGAKPHKNMSASEKSALKKRQMACMLPARTEEEAMNLTSFVWSLDV